MAGESEGIADRANVAVGFVGLGQIGRPLVESLLRAGLPVVVHDLDPDVVDRVVAAGASPAASLADMATAVDLVGVCVPADAHVRAVLDGPDGLLAHLRRGSVVAIHSTVLPETVLWAEAEAGPRAIAVVEAAVTGGAMAAAEGRSTFLLGGDRAALARLEPVLDACGSARVNAGGLGAASRLKLCVNLQSYVTFLGVFEAARLATRHGLSLDALKSAMAANGQLSELIDTYLLLHEFGPETLAEPATQASLAGYAAIIEKDLRLIEALAAEVGEPVPAARLASERAGHVYFLDEPAAAD